jgi:CheY-like chemotaxis protein
MMDHATISDTASPTYSSPTSPVSNRRILPAAQILIVDDNAINRSVSHSHAYSLLLANTTQLLAAFMKRFNYSYQEAANGKEALEAYQNSTVKFQTILMDMSMPISKYMKHTPIRNTF